MTTDELNNAYAYADKLRKNAVRSLLSTRNKPNHTDKELTDIEYKKNCLDTICEVLLGAVIA